MSVSSVIRALPFAPLLAWPGAAARVLSRALAIPLVRRGASYADAAREVGFSREAVREWSDDRAGLLRPHRIGKPRALTDDQLQELDDFLETAAAWRMSDLQAFVVTRFAVSMSLDALVTLVRLLGYGTRHWRWFRTPRRVPFRIGDRATCAVTTAGTTYCWGEDLAAASGPDAGPVYLPPTVVTGIPTAVQVAVGSAHACILGTDGTVWCWGANVGEQCGPLASGSVAATPVQVPL